MVREIVRDVLLLSRKAEQASKEDLPAAADLMDTLRAHADSCVGMAANMIGVNKRIIAVSDGKDLLLMFNPELIKCADPYQAEEGCLSLPGIRKVKRYRSIKVRYQNMDFSVRIKTFTGWTAQIIQHEMDHCSGILI